ncbi:MAG: 3-oxoacyl-(acyl-carrier-protein) reductase FabG [Bacteroidetes bacterium ADurb.BinA395]|nr:MAG: 3-oxoacyl-(acyl-carrier-protein) reductase FabG [Bacteroidetes bacterium ADurb.BinA395]
MNVININLGGTFRAIRSVLPFMYKKGFGRIINFSSIVAQKGVIGTSAYAASKSALWGMTKAIAAENAQKGITINNINLGYMNAGMTLNEVPENLREEIIKQNPSKKLGDLENVYKTVKYLMDTEYINGTSIDLNGGLL